MKPTTKTETRYQLIGPKGERSVSHNTIGEAMDLLESLEYFDEPLCKVYKVTTTTTEAFEEV